MERYKEEETSPDRPKQTKETKRGRKTKGREFSKQNLMPHPVKCFGNVEGHIKSFTKTLEKRTRIESQERLPVDLAWQNLFCVIRKKGMKFWVFKRVGVKEGFHGFRDGRSETNGAIEGLEQSPFLRLGCTKAWFQKKGKVVLVSSHRQNKWVSIRVSSEELSSRTHRGTIFDIFIFHLELGEYLNDPAVGKYRKWHMLSWRRWRTVD